MAVAWAFWAFFGSPFATKTVRTLLSTTYDETLPPSRKREKAERLARPTTTSSGSDKYEE